MLKHKDGYVLKPIEKPACGEREIKFYQDLQGATDPVSVELKKLVPKYLGNTMLKINDEGKTFLKSSVRLLFFFLPQLTSPFFHHIIYSSKGVHILLFNIIQKLQLLWHLLMWSGLDLTFLAILSWFNVVGWLYFPDGHLQCHSEFNEVSTIQLVLFSGGTVVWKTVLLNFLFLISSLVHQFDEIWYALTFFVCIHFWLIVGSCMPFCVRKPHWTVTNS